jgi:hypothetical protein
VIIFAYGAACWYYSLDFIMGIDGQTNGGNGIASYGLRIVVIGAGIGGLSAAINLLKQGHDVTVKTQLGGSGSCKMLTVGLLDLRVQQVRDGAGCCHSYPSKCVWAIGADGDRHTRDWC